MAGAEVTSSSFLILDADALIKLAQHPANLEAIQAITRAVKKGSYDLIVPEPALNAFNREKQRATDAYWKVQRSNIKGLRQLREVSSASAEIADLADRLSRELDGNTSEIPKTIKVTETLLKKGKLIPVTGEMKVSAADRVAGHRPPAKNARNSSINDCIIWEVVKKWAAEGSLVFVTDNYKDFSDPEHREKLHPDLSSELGASPKVCYHSLENFQKAHIKNVEIVVPPPASAICPACHEPISPNTTPRPSQYGGWTYQLYCWNCQTYIDTGDPYDD